MSSPSQTSAAGLPTSARPLINGFKCEGSVSGFGASMAGMRRKAASLEACAALCSSQPTCDGVEWEWKPRDCFVITHDGPLELPKRNNRPGPGWPGAGQDIEGDQLDFILCVRSPVAPQPVPKRTAAVRPSASNKALAKEQITATTPGETPSDGCWNAITSTVSDQMGLGASVGACLYANLTKDACSSASACAVVQTASSSRPCLAEMCAESPALSRWTQLCEDGAVVAAFHASAQRSCGGLQMESSEPERETDWLIPLLVVLSIVCCFAAICTHVLLRRHRRKRQELQELADGGANDVPKAPLEINRESFSLQRQQSGKARRSKHNVWDPREASSPELKTSEAFQAFVEPSLMKKGPKEVDRFQLNATHLPIGQKAVPMNKPSVPLDRVMSPDSRRHASLEVPTLAKAPARERKDGEGLHPHPSTSSTATPKQPTMQPQTSDRSTNAPSDEGTTSRASFTPRDATPSSKIDGASPCLGRRPSPPTTSPCLGRRQPSPPAAWGLPPRPSSAGGGAAAGIAGFRVGSSSAARVTFPARESFSGDSSLEDSGRSRSSAGSLFGKSWENKTSPFSPTFDKNNLRAAANGASDGTHGAQNASQIFFTSLQRSASCPSRPSCTIEDDKEHIESPELLAVRLAQLRKSTDLEVRRAFFKAQCKRWHPDKNPGEETHAKSMFQMLQEKKRWFLEES